MKNVEAQGYNKEEALLSTGLGVELDRLKNATSAWKKAGSPLNTKDLNKFMAAYIKEKKAVGAYIVVEASSDDARLRPYSVINETTIGKRKTTTVYQIKPAELSVKYHTEVKTVVNKETGEEKQVEVQTPYVKETITVETVNKETGETESKQKEVEIPQVKVVSIGAVEGRAGKKDEALKIMKELITKNGTDYVIEIAKEVTDGQRFAAYGKYTPSKSAKVGKFVFFVEE